MAGRLLGAKSLPDPMSAYWQLDSKEQTSVQIKQNVKVYFQKNIFENVQRGILCMLFHNPC